MPGGGMNGSPGPSAETSPVHGQPASLRHTTPRRWHRMPRHLAYDPTGKNIVCHRQNHCMLLAKSLYAIGKIIVCYWRERQTTNHGRSECRDVCLHHARCTVQPERQRTTAIHPLRADETLACVSIFCRCHWLSCPTRAERAARMLRISPSYLARLTAEPRKRRR